MSARLEPGRATDATAQDAEWEPVPPDQVVEASPATRYVDIDDDGGRVIGVWEHSPGVSTDVEGDEVFVVLAGAGVLEFAEPALPSVELRPGVVVRLTAGMRTVWTVHETLRKVYIAP